MHVTPSRGTLIRILAIRRCWLGCADYPDNFRSLAAAYRVFRIVDPGLLVWWPDHRGVAITAIIHETSDGRPDAAYESAASPCQRVTCSHG